MAGSSPFCSLTTASSLNTLCPRQLSPVKSYLRFPFVARFSFISGNKSTVKAVHAGRGADLSQWRRAGWCWPRGGWSGGHGLPPPGRSRPAQKVPQLLRRPPAVPPTSSVALNDFLLTGASAGDLRGPWVQWEDLKAHKSGDPIFLSLTKPVPSSPHCLISKSSTDAFGVLSGSVPGAQPVRYRKVLGFSQLIVRGRCPGVRWTCVPISLLHLFSSCVPLCRLQNFPQPPFPHLYNGGEQVFCVFYCLED